MALLKRKFVGFVIGAVTALLLIICISIVSLYLYPNQVLAFTTSHMLGRAVTFANIQIHLSDTLQIEIDDIHVANRSWSKSPDIFYANHITADLNRQSLLRMRAKFEQLTITGAYLLLERNERGIGNWKNDEIPHTTEQSPAEEARRSRLSLPTILNLQIDNSDIEFITSSKAVLAIAFNTLNLHTKTESQPVELFVDGSYNKLPVQINIDTQSFEDLHAVDKPFKIAATAKGGSLLLHLNVESMDPMNFDQFKGQLHADTINLGQAAVYFSDEFEGKWPLTFDSTIERNDRHWKLSAINGSLNSNIFHDSLVNLEEGERFQPDTINTLFNFDHIDINGLQKRNQATRKNDKELNRMAWVDLGKNPTTLIDATLKAKKAKFGSATLSNLNIQGEIANGVSGIQNISFNVLGATITSSLISKIKNNNAYVSLSLKARDIDAAQILQALKIKSQFLVGYFGLTVQAKGQGDSLPILKKTAMGEIHLTIKNGGIERWANHLAASDITTIFDQMGNLVPVESLIANVKFRNGIGTLSPFIFKTEEGTLLGQGTIDLPENRLSLLFHTDPSTTSGWALDIPIKVSGPFSDVRIQIHP